MTDNTLEANAKCFDDLPNEIIIKIFSFMDLNDLISVANVNSRWEELSQVNSIWKNIIFRPKWKMTLTEKIQLLQKTPALKAYSDMYESDIGLILNTICTHCKEFKHLHLSGGHTLTLRILEKFFQTFPGIEKLDIPILIQEDQLQLAQLISQLNKLTHLRLSHRYLSVEGVLKPIAEGCPSLLYMDLGDSEFMDDDIRYFLQKKHKQILSFELWCPISSTTFQWLTKCSNLEELTVSTCNEFTPTELTYDDILLLRKLNKLKKLKLKYMYFSLAEALPSVFAMKGLPNLVDLNLTCVDVNEKHLMEIILNCPLLTHLYLFYLDITFENPFGKIGNCTNLKTLSLLGCGNVTRHCIDLVAEQCPLLEHIDLSRSIYIKDDVILAVLKLKQLRTICVSESGFSGKHFDLFPKYLTHLRKIIAHDTDIDDSIWEGLLKEIPFLKIVRRFWEDDNYYL